MTLTIHRGAHEIGGCCTELRTKRSRILIDFGARLPAPDGTPRPDTLSVPGVSEPGPACDAVFFTHSHGDHIGHIGRILPDVPLYMGACARDICLEREKRLQSAHKNHPADCPEDHSGTLAALERSKVFHIKKPPLTYEAVTAGDFRVTPLRVDHSAFDSCMFLIEAEGLRILHTGDFREHGFTGNRLRNVLKHYAGNVDWLITEGTMLSRPEEGVMTEKELSEKAGAIMAENKNVFVLCSSTNIDRIRAIYEAKPKDRPGVCDDYQKKVLNIAAASAAGKAFRYDFRYVIPDHEWNYKLHDWMEEQGFVMFVRNTPYFRKLMENYKGNCKVIYSMWSGYLKNKDTLDFVEQFDWVSLHTSGHATAQTLKAVCDTVHPRRGVVPIHSEASEALRELLPGVNVMLPDDGVDYALGQQTLSLIQ